MNVGFHYRGVDAEFHAVFQAELDGRLNHGLVDGLQRGRGEAVEGPVEGVVLGDKVAVKLRKAAQRVAIVDTLAQFAIVPVLDAHERSEEHTSELQSPCNLVCRLLLEKTTTTNYLLTPRLRTSEPSRTSSHMTCL